MYYINICKEQNIGRDLLREKIRNNEYKRLPEETKNYVEKCMKLYKIYKDVQKTEKT